MLMPKLRTVSGHGYTVRVFMRTIDGGEIYDNVNISAKSLQEAYEIVNTDLPIRAEFFLRFPDAISLDIDGGWVKPLRCSDHDWQWITSTHDECLTCGRRRYVNIIRKMFRSFPERILR